MGPNEIAEAIAITAVAVFMLTVTWRMKRIANNTDAILHVILRHTGAPDGMTDEASRGGG
jgi:hypothetical protein